MLLSGNIPMRKDGTKDFVIMKFNKMAATLLIRPDQAIEEWRGVRFGWYFWKIYHLSQLWLCSLNLRVHSRHLRKRVVVSGAVILVMSFQPVSSYRKAYI
jgi:hypothetical protein